MRLLFSSVMKSLVVYECLSKLFSTLLMQGTLYKPSGLHTQKNKEMSIEREFIGKEDIFLFFFSREARWNNKNEKGYNSLHATMKL